MFGRITSVKIYTAALLLIFMLSESRTMGQDYNILPLGNSITSSFSNQPSYRYYLWELLQDDQININFVGGESGNFNGNYSSWPPEFDTDHEGHSGWTVDEIGDSLVFWLSTYIPDMALVHLGTNDILQSQTEATVDQTVQELKGVIKILRMANPKMTIFLAKITPLVDPIKNSGVILLNNKIPDIATDLFDPSSPIIIVDCNSILDTSTDYRDLVHPNAAGEEKMAIAFHAAIMNNLPSVKHRWTGGSSTDWYTASNWNKNSIPTHSDDVVIQSGATNWPAIAGDFRVGTDCADFTMEPAAQFTVGGDFIVKRGKYVSINGSSSLNVGGDWADSETYYGGGKINKSETGGYNSLDVYSKFNCTTPFHLVSAKVYAESGPASIHTFYWATSDGTIQQTAEVLVPPGESRVTLDFDIPVGTDHRIGRVNTPANTTGLWRDIVLTGVGYPFAIGTVGVITSSSYNETRFYYLYDFEYIPVEDPSSATGLVFGSSLLNFNGSSDITVTDNIIFSGGGKVDKSGSGGNRGDGFNTFDCLHPFRLLSAKIYAGGTGTKAFYWISADGSLGDTVNVNIPFTGEQRVELNFLIPPGIDHRLGIISGGPSLWRDLDAGGYDFPFSIGNVGVLTASSNFERLYYFLYDLEFAACFYDVIISKPGYSLSTAGSMAVANALTLKEGAYFTVSPGDTLSVGNNFNLLANATGVASFLSEGTFDLRGIARVEQFLSQNRYHYLSSPVSNGRSGVFTGAFLKFWNEPDYSWNYITATTVPLVVMRGYSFWNYDDPYTAVFEGILNDGPQNINVSNLYVQAGEDDYPGWNLVGNPFPSSLDWDEAGWTKTNVDNAIYFWSGQENLAMPSAGGGNFGSYVNGVGTNGATSIIPPGQGFYVRCANVGGTGYLSVDNNARKHGSQAFYKEDGAMEMPLARVKVNGLGETFDETVVRFSEQASDEFDSEYDATKLFGYNYPQLYSITPQGRLLTISTLHGYNDGVVIPLGFTAPVDGIYSISLTEFVHFDDGTSLFLEDKLTGTTRAISENPDYEFAASQKDDPNRFLLFFVQDAPAENEPELAGMTIYSFDKDVFVVLPESATNSLVRILDMTGRTVYSEIVSGNMKTTIPVSGTRGVYAVIVTTSDSVYSRKVFIQ